MKKLFRSIVYFCGLMLLAAGLMLNTKAALGTSAIVSVPYAVSKITGIVFGDMTFVWYSIFVAAEIVMHIIARKNVRSKVIMDLLQIPLSLGFTRVMNFFSGYIPTFAVDMAGTFWGSLLGRILVIFAAVLLTGIGAAMSLNMRLVPNPGDGIVQTISDATGRKVGFVKNMFDLGCVTLTALISLAFLGRIEGVGLGTLISVIGVGRTIAVFNRLFHRPMKTLAGQRM